jgi:hypothetical protein
MKDVKYFEQQKSDIIDTLKGAISVSPDMEAEQTIESINQVINRMKQLQPPRPTCNTCNYC